MKEDKKDEQTKRDLNFKDEIERFRLEREPDRDLTEEELFLEEVLLAQEEALREEAERRKKGIPSKKRLNKGARFMVWIMSFALIFSMVAFIFQMYSIPAIEFLKTSARLSSDEIVQEYKKAVVEISTGSSKGTGFAISSDGYIVTNSHVIEDALQLTVIFPEIGMMEAEVIEDYPEIDLAVIKVNEEKLPHLSLASSTVESEQHITFIGNPLAFTGIANEGTYIGIYEGSLAVQSYMLDAPVYKGNSGSPVIDKNGEVIGIIYATLKHPEHGKVGLFIPIDALHERFEIGE